MSDGLGLDPLRDESSHNVCGEVTGWLSGDRASSSPSSAASPSPRRSRLSARGVVATESEQSVSYRTGIRRRVGTDASSTITNGDDWKLFQAEDGNVHYVAWQCLPDTVDPRGPKGK